MDIVFKGRHTDVLEKFRKHATGKLEKVVEKLDSKTIGVDVEVTAERNPRQSGRKERVELTIFTRGPVIRAEAAAEDRFAALDMALAKLEARLRRACDRRKTRNTGVGVISASSVPLSRAAPENQVDNNMADAAAAPADTTASVNGVAPEAEVTLDNRVPIAMDGEGPLVIREKFHVACPMTIDQALFEMELVGHDFFLFTDTTDGLPSVVYRRRGYQYGVIRLVEEEVPAPEKAPAPARARAGDQAVPASR